MYIHTYGGIGTRRGIQPPRPKKSDLSFLARQVIVAPALIQLIQYLYYRYSNYLTTKKINL